ncbi:hypothetical protein R6Q57_004380 [Mikania cordata]
MAKNQTSQTPPCDKIRKATFGRFRRIDNSMPSKARVTHTQPIALQQHVSIEIPIEYVPPVDTKSVKNIRFSSQNATKNGGFANGKELVDQSTFGDSKFDSFIGRMKMKMSVPSDVGDVETIDRHDTFNDKVSNFIDHVKVKFRATSTMGANEKHEPYK